VFISKKKKKLLNWRHINREKPVDFNYQTSANTHTLPSAAIREAVIFARANHEFDLTQPLGYIFARGSLGTSVTAATVRRNARMHACDIRHRHPRTHTRNACVFVRGSLKTRRFYLTKPPRTGQLTRGADVTFENEADGVATLVIMPLRRWLLIALFRINTDEERVGKLNHLSLSSISFWKLYLIYPLTIISM